MKKSYNFIMNNIERTAVGEDPGAVHLFTMVFSDKNVLYGKIEMEYNMNQANRFINLREGL